MVELLLLAPEACVERVSDALIDELDALSVSVEDADANTRAEHPMFGEPGMPALSAGWQRSVVKALFESEALALEAATLLLAQDWVHGVQLQSITALQDQDWVRLTQSQFTPVSVTPDFWIVPSWHEPPAAAKKVVRLDPGLAFGTGTHPTTRMCLRWTALHAPEGDLGWARVLDYGCGSGILAIGAALFGAHDIDAVDIDPSAIESARANAIHNGVALRTGPPESVSGTYAVVFANILASPLKLLAPVLCACVEAGGDLILAGILERQADEMKSAYAPWLALDVSDSDDGWILMTGRRPV
jgi:ribosomal protein L11 methyltransferase